MDNLLSAILMKFKINKKYHLPLFFLFCLIFFSILQFSFSEYLGHDAYYHAKVSQLMWEGKGLLHEFPWLQNTILRDNFVEHHLLFHLILMPFVGLLPVVLGGKIAVVLFASLAMSSFYWLLKRLRVAAPGWWSLVLIFSSTSFVFRLNLLRAQSLALVLLVLGTYAIVKNKYLALFLVTFAYTWFFDGFIVLGITTGIYFVTNACVYLRRHSEKKLKILLSYLAPVGIFLAGVGTAVILNPYFPDNVWHLYFHLYKVAMHNSFSDLPVGGEWMSPNYQTFILSSLPIVMLFLFIVVVFAIQIIEKRIKPLPRDNIFFVVAAVGFLMLTIIAQRMTEYWVLFTVLAGATVWNHLWNNYGSRIKEALATINKNRVVVAKMSLACILIFYGVFFTHKNIQQMKNYFTQHEAGYKQAALWIKDNVTPGEIVFHIDWGDFPLLFFYNTQNYYISGLDPNFMLEQDENTFNKWSKIFYQEDLEKMYSVVKYDFNSNYILITKKFPEAKKYADQDPRFEHIYKEDMDIYRLKDY